MLLDDLLNGVHRSVLPLAILRLLADGSAHGYALTASLAKMGFGTVRGGSLYPLLRSMEEAGLIDSEWQGPSAGPARKVFSISEAGLQVGSTAEIEVERLLRSLWNREDSHHGQL